MTSPLTVIQISDLHIQSELGVTMEGINTENSFKQLLKHVHQAYKNIDLVLVTGDLAQDPIRKSYEKIYAALKQYNIPTSCLPGNHDVIELMQEVISGEIINCNKLIQFNHWQIINLNSKKVGAKGGYLNSSELAFLKNNLNRNKELQTLIAMHHHPIPTGSRWMDTMMVENREELFDLLKNHPQVKILCCGHIHQEMDKIKDNKQILGTPSSCFQFKPYSIEYGLDTINAGYRVFTLHSNGTFESTIQRLPNEQSYSI